MKFNLVLAVDLLRRTPSIVDRLLRGTDESWHRGNEGEGTWSPRDIVGHLIHGDETDWIPRAQAILKHGESRPFEPFDRFAQQHRFLDWSLDRLLDRFQELRLANVRILEGLRLTERELLLTGRHPELGTVNLQQLLATWVVHDLDHLGQLSRVMAKQYGGEVGAWKAYLPILGR